MSVGTQVASLYGVLSLQDDMTPKLKDAEREIGTFDTRSKQLGAGMVKIGAGMTAAGLGLAVMVGAIAKPAVDMARQWEEAFGRVSRAMDGTPEDIQAIEDGLRKLATSSASPVSSLKDAHLALAGIAEVGAKFNVPTENLLKFTRAMGELQMATDGAISGEKAAAMVAEFATLAGMDYSNIDRLTSALYWISQNTGKDAEAVLAMSIAITSAGKAAGLHEQDILGFSAAVLQLSPGASGETVNKFLGEFVRILGEGGPALDTLASIAGTDPKFFTELFASDPSAALLAFFEGFAGLDMTAQAAALESMGITAGPLQKLIMDLATNYGLLIETVGGSGDAWKRGDDATEAAAKKAQELNAKWERLNNGIKELVLQVGQALLPILQKILDFMQPVIDKVILFAQENPKLAETIAAIVMGLGALGVVMTIVGPIITGIGLAIGLVGAPMLILIGVVAALAYVIYKNWDDIKNWTVTAWDTVKNAIQSFIDWLGNLSVPIPGWIGDIANALGGLINQIGQVTGFTGGGGASTEFAQNVSAAWGIPMPSTNSGGGGGGGGTPWQAALPTAVKAATSASKPKSLGGKSIARAAGGPVFAGGAYMVGERGPELFIPGVSGAILPNSSSGGGTSSGRGGTTVIQVMLPDGRVLFEAVADEAARRNVPAFARATG